MNRFVPLGHYYVLNTKFDTLAEAIDYLEGKGYRFDKLTETYLPRWEGG